MMQKYVLTRRMKKFLLSLILVAFAFAVQAGDVKDTKTKSTAATKAAAKTECSADKKDSCCCKAETKKQVLLSPKAAADKRA